MAAQHGSLPMRSNTHSTGYNSDDEDGPMGDPSSTVGLLEERLQAWKHACGYLEDYIKAIAKDQHSQSKDSEKILKTLKAPLKEGHHFDQNTGGIGALFEGLKANTMAQGNLYAETESHLTRDVLPLLERLHNEIKHKRKELTSGAGKQSKAVDQARAASQKHIEQLGQAAAQFDNRSGGITAQNDPYVLSRGLHYRLNNQINEENNSRSDLVSIQSNFAQFEAHLVQSIQEALSRLNQYMSQAHQKSGAFYGDSAQKAGMIDPSFEWNGFVRRNNNVLISPDAPVRSLSNVSYPNQDHKATKALVEGTLERKSKGIGGLGGYKTNYYAITPAGFMHEYKDNDNTKSEPTPETSFYLPDCVVGALDGNKFAVKGKDTSGGKLSQKLSGSSEYTFKANTAQDAAQWHQIVADVCSGNFGPTSAVAANQTGLPTEHQQQTGVIGSGTAVEQGSGSGLAANAQPMASEQQAVQHQGVSPQQGVPHQDTMSEQKY